MSAPRLSLVMGGSTSAAEGSDLSLPFPESGTVHLHLHLGERAGPATEEAKRPLGGWGGLIVGVGLMAAFAGGYQIGHRPAPDDVSNLRPMPALGSLVPPEPAMPSAAALGLPGHPAPAGDAAADHRADAGTAAACHRRTGAEHGRSHGEPQRLRPRGLSCDGRPHHRGPAGPV